MKGQSGITLVALIITIIVLLILAMVSISLVMNSGIINKTNYATNTYQKHEVNETNFLNYVNDTLTTYDTSTH